MIVTTNDVLHGAARVDGTRIPVYAILGVLSWAKTFDGVRKSWPRLSDNDIEDALQYASRVVEDAIAKEQEPK